MLNIRTFFFVQPFQETPTKTIEDTLLGLDYLDGVDRVLFPLAGSMVVGIDEGVLGKREGGEKRGEGGELEEGEGWQGVEKAEGSCMCLDGGNR